MSEKKENILYIFQKGFNYSQDGPGNRLVYHLSGCNMFCPWCSNPEGLKRGKKSAEISVDDLVKEAMYSKMIFINGGGVTFTGGEVTMQKESVLAAIKKLHEKGINTCIETNASLPCCEELFSEVDYMIADFKSPDKIALLNIAGGQLDTVKGNLLYRAKTGKPLLVRVPLIHFFNCGEENAQGFADFFKILQNESGNENLYFEILTYHEFGKKKYETENIAYAVTDGFVSKGDIKLLQNKIKENNLKLITT